MIFHSLEAKCYFLIQITNMSSYKINKVFFPQVLKAWVFQEICLSNKYIII